MLHLLASADGLLTLLSLRRRSNSAVYLGGGALIERDGRDLLFRGRFDGQGQLL